MATRNTRKQPVELVDSVQLTCTQVEEIVPTETSSGVVQVLGGSGAPVAEDIGGCAEWQEMTEDIVKPTTTLGEKFDIAHRAFHSLNYRERYWELKGWSFDWFDVSDARRAIKMALNSPTTTYGRLPMTGVPDRDRVVRWVPDPETGRVREEVSPILDDVKRSACTECGKPDGLKLCTGCRARYYCSEGCQQVSGGPSSPYLVLAEVYDRQASLEKGAQTRVQATQNDWCHQRFGPSLCMT